MAQLYDFLSHYELAVAPGERYGYSNLGVALLGHALSLKAGKPNEALLIERVLEPLGLRDTRISLTPDMTARLAAGHDPYGARVANWDLPTLAGAGALRSTANDSFIGYDPVRRVAIVVLANASSDIDDLALHLLNPRYPLKEFVKRSEVQVGRAQLDSLVGQYALAPTFVLTVTHEGGNLFIQATGQSKLQVFAESDSTFYYQAVDAQVSFARDGTGRANEIVLHQNGRSTPGKRLP